MYATQPRVGRKKRFTERIMLLLADGTSARIDATKVEGSSRLDFIREAIERLLMQQALNSRIDKVLRAGESRTEFLQDAIERELGYRERRKLNSSPTGDAGE